MVKRVQCIDIWGEVQSAFILTALQEANIIKEDELIESERLLDLWKRLQKLPRTGLRKLQEFVAS